MQTPDGTECGYYYEDFNRGRAIQQCRIPKHPKSAPWRLTDCAKCPVPRILQANASTHLKLTLQIKATLLGFGRGFAVEALCSRHQTLIDDPYVGCLECNKERPGLDIFRSALEDE